MHWQTFVRSRLNLRWSHFCADQNPIQRDIYVIIRSPDNAMLVVHQRASDCSDGVDDAAGAAVAIIEGVDALELVMNQRHLDEWIGVKHSIV